MVGVLFIHPNRCVDDTCPACQARLRIEANVTRYQDTTDQERQEIENENKGLLQIITASIM